MKKSMKKMPSARMKTKNVMKAKQKIMKKPAAAKADAARTARSRLARSTAKKERGVQNARHRAKMAARDGKKYSPRSKELKELASAAHGAEIIAMAAHAKAEGAEQEAAEAKANAGAARSVADAAHSMAEECNEQNVSFRSELEQGKETLRRTEALAKQNAETTKQNTEQLLATEEALAQLHTLAQHNAQRLDSDDRKRGYVTPPTRQSGPSVNKKPAPDQK